MIIHTGTVDLIAEAAADGTLSARRMIVVDGDTGKREQVWPEASRPVLRLPVDADRVPGFESDQEENVDLPAAGHRRPRIWTITRQ